MPCDHWGYQESNTLPSRKGANVRGTEREMLARLYDRADRLKRRGWRLVMQRNMPAPSGAGRVMVIRLDPAEGYEHCGTSILVATPCTEADCRAKKVSTSRPLETE